MSGVRNGCSGLGRATLEVTHLDAISAGVRAETVRFTGSVHSVFARACNLGLDDGRLLALLVAEAGNAPNAIRLATPPGFAFNRVLEPGEPVGCRAGMLRCAGGRVTARLAGAPVWCLELDGLEADLRKASSRAAWLRVRRELRRREAAGAIGRLLSIPRALPHRLWDGARTRDVESTTHAVEGLIGRGAGLTPAGDDIVVGFLAGLRASARREPAPRRFLDALGGAVLAAAHRTNRISRVSVLDAVAGEFAEPLADLVAAIARGDPRRVISRAMRAALAVGATSGADGARGVLLGLAAWGREPTSRRGTS